MAAKTALVLSGGGGRGAYHVGVITALVERGWMRDGVGPDILAGTSIGAINAAALASGQRVAELRDRWLAMHTEEVHRLAQDIPLAARPLMRFILRSVLTSDAHGGAQLVLPPEQRDLTAQGLFERIGQVFRATPFRSLLDTRPWRQTLAAWMDFDRINDPQAPTLLITATDIQTGGLRVFANRQVGRVPPTILTIDHLMASSSIPMVYPWTEIDGAKYWDGAVLANTPLGPVIDAAGADDVDIIVVMMTPWNTDEDELRAQLDGVPEDLVQGLSLTLDWALLASYRSAVKMLHAYNRLAAAAALLARAAQQTGDPTLAMTGRVPRAIRTPLVIAPERLMPLAQMIDYEEPGHLALFTLGYADAIRALDARMLAQMLDPAAG